MSGNFEKFWVKLRVWGTKRVRSSQDALPQTGFKALRPSVSLDKSAVSCWGYAEESKLNSIATIMWYHEQSTDVVDLYILIPGVSLCCKLMITTHYTMSIHFIANFSISALNVPFFCFASVIPKESLQKIYSMVAHK